MKTKIIYSAISVIILSFMILQGGCKKDSTNNPDEEIPLEDQGLPYHKEHWMTDVHDSLYLTQITIPGSHDAGADKHTSKIPWYDAAEKPYIICQDFMFINQMKLGIRWFDIRLDYHNNGELTLYHGKYNLHKSFDDILNGAIGFLSTRPSEVIILMIGQEHSSASDKDFSNAVYDKIKNHGLSHFYLHYNIPKLENVRGKIYIVRKCGNHTGHDFGIYFNWSNNTTGSQTTHNNINLYAQDHYSLHTVTTNTKLNQVISCYEKAHNENNPHTFYLNFVSGERVPEETLWKTADDINSRINNSLAAKGVNYNNCGIIMINFAGGGDVKSGDRNCCPNLIKQILCRNDGVRY